MRYISITCVMEMREYRVDLDDDKCRRLDVFVLNMLVNDCSIKIDVDINRSFVNQMIREGNVQIDHFVVKKKGKKLNNGSLVTLSFLEYIGNTVHIHNEEYDFDVEVVWEDDLFLALSKPTGLIVHPVINGQGELNRTLMNWVLHRGYPLSDLEGMDRRGVVHRIDRDTAGLIVMAKTNEAHALLKKQFMERRVSKKYLAIVDGKVEDTGTRMMVIEKGIARKKGETKMKISVTGKDSITRYRLLEHFTVRPPKKQKKSDFSLLEIWPQTGRTHQIRVHLSSSGLPIVGDSLYSPGRSIHLIPPSFIGKMMLFSQTLQFNHPSKGETQIEAPLPPHFDDFLGWLRKSQFSGITD